MIFLWFAIAFIFVTAILIICKAIYYRIEYNRIVNELKCDNSFDVDFCDEQDLILRCKELNFDDESTTLAIEFFIKKTKQSIIADRLCIDEKSVQRRKIRMKHKLNS